VGDCGPGRFVSNQQTAKPPPDRVVINPYTPEELAKRGISQEFTLWPVFGLSLSPSQDRSVIMVRSSFVSAKMVIFITDQGGTLRDRIHLTLRSR